jgi:hypothetical protein
LIVLSNGEKINPIPMESVILSDSFVKSVLIVGEYRFSPSLMVEMEHGNEPKTDVERLEAMRKIWPTVQESNRFAPGFAKIPKSLILFAICGKPFLRAGKGTVQRQMTVKLYSKELDQLLSSQQNDLLIEGLTLETSRSSESVKTFTGEIYSQALEIKDLHGSYDAFYRGMDSLKVLLVVQRFRAAVHTIGALIFLEDINPRLIYSSPSVDKMTEAILGLAHKMEGIEQNHARGQDEKLTRTVLAWSTFFHPCRKAGKLLQNVLLTGTTSSLGSYLLAAFDNMPNSEVGKIYCLNRSPNSKDRQKKSSTARGLNTAWENERVEFLQADLSQLELGLGPEKYAEPLNDTTVVIHNDWQVDFNLILDFFESRIRGVRNLLDFSAQSAHKAPLIFMSSVSIVYGWMALHPGEMVPEAVPDDFDAPEQIGYAESMFICKHLVQNFSRSSQVLFCGRGRLRDHWKEMVYGIEMSGFQAL